MKALGFALAATLVACTQTETPAPSAPARPTSEPAPQYMPPIAPVYVAPANTTAANAGPPPLTGSGSADAGAPQDAGAAERDVAIPDKLTVTPADGFADGEKVDMFVRAKARECYREALRQDPKADGRVALKLVIDDKGAVTRVSASLDGTLPISLGECVEKKSMPAFFKAPTKPPVTVVVPMTLTLKKRK